MQVKNLWPTPTDSNAVPRIQDIKIYEYSSDPVSPPMGLQWILNYRFNSFDYSNRMSYGAFGMWPMGTTQTLRISTSLGNRTIAVIS